MNVGNESFREVLKSSELAGSYFTTQVNSKEINTMPVPNLEDIQKMV